MGRLEGKTALITGSARGIGLGIARAFVAEGAGVVMTDINDDEGRARAHELGASYARLDVRRETDWERVIGGMPRLDILVNNAGITGFEPENDEPPEAHDPEHASLDSWHGVLATNLDGAFLGCKHAIRKAREQAPDSGPGSGSIINLSSRSGVVGIPRAAAYAASKAAVRHHTKSVALYCAEENLAVRCNSIQPAAIMTPMWDAMLGTGPEREANIATFAAGAPLNRFGTVDEVAALAVYLASDESGFTTGAEFNIDGGMLAGTTEPPRPAR